jgi:hypothetical protein
LTKFNSDLGSSLVKISFYLDSPLHDNKGVHELDFIFEAHWDYSWGEVLKEENCY